MTPVALLERLERLGVVVELAENPEHPIVLRPANLIPDELRPEIVAQKVELAELMQRRRSVPEPWRADPSRLSWPSPLGQDPRPDLPGSGHWHLLLLLAARDADDPQGTYGRLLAARACGAVLVARGGRWKIEPTVDPDERLSVWQDRESWDRDAATWLGPRTKEITSLLRRLPGQGQP